MYPACLASLVALSALSWVGCNLLSPKQADEIKPSIATGIEAGAGAKVTNVSFQWAGKAGWFATPLTLLGWVVATIKVRRREQAADELILSIKACGDAAFMVKSHVAKKNNDWINKRVKKIT